MNVSQRLAFEQHLVAAGVDDEVVDLDRRGIVLRELGLAAEHGPNARQQHAWTERLSDVIVGTEFQAADDVGLSRFGRDHHDGNVLRLRIAFQQLADREAIDSREHQIQEDQIGQIAPRLLNGYLAGREGGGPGNPPCPGCSASVRANLPRRRRPEYAALP